MTTGFQSPLDKARGAHQLRAEYVRRNTPFEEKTFSISDRESALAAGWELKKENKFTLRFARLREHDEILENEFWCLLYRLGYSHLSIGRRFQITVTTDKKHGATPKEIDVFAYDDKTVIVAQCGSNKERGSRQLSKNLNELAGLQRPIANALRKHFKGDPERRIIWAFVTRNIKWSAPDLARAKQHNIAVIRDSELRYFNEIAKRIGPAARYQFHAEFLRKTKALEHVRVFALRTRLGGRVAYSFFAPADKILPIAFVNHRDLRDPEASPSYQRLVQAKRLREIGNFLRSGGYFPNSIIINLKERPKFDMIKPADDDGIAVGELTLPNKYKSAMIIDGQHRLYGYTELPAGHSAADLPIVAFVDMPVEKETELFGEINSKQKNVQKQLLDEIAGEIKLNSADPHEQMRAISSRALDWMRDDETGPFGNMISGVDVKATSSALTLPFLNQAIKDARLLGDTIKKDGTTRHVTGILHWEKPKEGVEGLERLLTAYFTMFREASPQRWYAGKEGVFGRNVGVAGLIRLIADLAEHHRKKTGEDARYFEPEEIVEKIRPYLEPVLDDFKTLPVEQLAEKYSTQYGSGGPVRFRFACRKTIFAKFADFKPEGFQEELDSQDVKRTQKGDALVRAIQAGVPEFISKSLREKYGDNDDYLKKAGASPQIIGDIAKARAEEEIGEEKSHDTYLNFVQWKVLVENSSNWESFKDALGIKLDDEPGRAKKDLVSWFLRFNKLRRIPGHPFNREYSDDDMKFLEILYQELLGRGVIGAIEGL